MNIEDCKKGDWIVSPGGHEHQVLSDEPLQHEGTSVIVTHWTRSDGEPSVTLVSASGLEAYRPKPHPLVGTLWIEKRPLDRLPLRLARVTAVDVRIRTAWGNVLDLQHAYWQIGEVLGDVEGDLNLKHLASQSPNTWHPAGKEPHP